MDLWVGEPNFPNNSAKTHFVKPAISAAAQEIIYLAHKAGRRLLLRYQPNLYLHFWVCLVVLFS